MLPQEVIRRKRDGHALTAEEIRFLVAGITDGTLGDAQVGAFAMAVCLNGMDMDERVVLTDAMARSGTALDWRGHDLPGPIVDKHSTGGVGDKVSLMLAPMLAACGAYVPMLSGRGLGHTGGTLDKLEAIPGYRTGVDVAELARVVAGAGCAIVGAGDDLAPADRRLYAVRDVTATVESLSLITASILSKKLAEGLDALVMDVKTGSGAFAADLDSARELATSIQTVARGAGLPTQALITDMSQVLGWNAGNALEVEEASAFLTGEAREPRLLAVTLALGAELLLLTGVARDDAEARARLTAALDSGSAAERFQAMIAALGGPPDFLEHRADRLPDAPVSRGVPAGEVGHVTRVDTRALGLVVVGLGGGRRRAGEVIDPRVGLSRVLPIGEPVYRDTLLATVHAASDADADAAAAAIREAVAIGAEPPGAAAVLERVGDAASP